MQITENPRSISEEIREKMDHYREQLLAAGMVEPTRRRSSSWHWLFYKPTTSLTAFVVNLRGSDYCVEVVYGHASTAFTRMAGDENALVEGGVLDEQITLRETIIICDEADEASARAQIAEMYSKYRLTEKDELLNCAKEKRKEFLQQIAGKLKPLGFRKKANTWTKPLEAECYVMFNAQKSSFSDEYYFNIYISKNSINPYGGCYFTRVAPSGMSPMDWQALNREEFDFFLEHTVVPALEQIIHTPLQELGGLPWIWSGCACNRGKCDGCWVENNLWEAKGGK